MPHWKSLANQKTGFPFKSKVYLFVKKRFIALKTFLRFCVGVKE